MFKVSRYTSDPTLVDSVLLVEGILYVKSLAYDIARESSKKFSGDYVAIYAEDGEQLAGFVDGKEVY